MKKFMGEDFLLSSQTAEKLYHEYAEGQPIYDFHNHLSPKEIAQKRRFSDLSELWLEGDHYKWRAMRACGAEEKYVTGDADGKEKFLAWAAVVPRLAGSPLYHWTHMELQRYFGIEEILCPESAERIWAQTQEMLASDGFDTVSLLRKMDVRVLCTTDDPADSLEWHKKIAEDPTITFRVLPSFRPDRYCGGDEAAESALCEKYGVPDCGKALVLALDHFRSCGCLSSDLGIANFSSSGRIEMLAGEYASRGMVMQLHLGPLRNVSPSLLHNVGKDAGGDCIGNPPDVAGLASLLGRLEENGKLPKTVLYNLDPSVNRAFAALAGSFAPRVQYGPAWWFNDHIRGIRAQLGELAETGMLASSVGMLTDSRSFTSFVRHEYYRRILCDFLGELIEEGLYPDDLRSMGRIVSDICYSNAQRFFEQ